MIIRETDDFKKDLENLPSERNLRKVEKEKKLIFNGLIDDVRIYNYARTAEQIQMDYQQGVGDAL